MPDHPIFEISPDEVAAIDDEGLRLLIGRLCEADLRRRGHPTSAVLYGGNHRAADGGVDVRVEACVGVCVNLPADTVIDGFIPRPATVYQSKAEDMTPSKITKEMRSTAKQAKGRKTQVLRPVIRELADTGGAYVIVSSESNVAGDKIEGRRAAMRAAVAELPGHEALHLDFYDRTRLATWVQEFPGVALWLRGRIGQTLSGWRPWGNWSHAARADAPYLSDETARLLDLGNRQNGPLPIAAGIAQLRTRLATPGGLVRLTGLSGTGKTRLLEALFDPEVGEGDLDPAQAVYADMGHEAPQPSPTQLATHLGLDRRRGILLLDNCRREDHDALAALVKEPGSTLSLITVDLDIRDDRPEDTDAFRLQGASEGVMEALIAQRHPNLSPTVAQRIADFSAGNARLALLAARGVGPGANLADLTDDGLFERLFHQRKPADPELLRAAQALALVYSFSAEATAEGEAEVPILAQIAGLEPRDLHRAIGELTRRELMQARGPWRALLPLPLAHWLARRALEDYPPLETARAILDCGRPRLLRSFAHRLSYLHDAPGAKKIAAAWLGPGGPFSDCGEVISRDLGRDAQVFAHLAAADPAAALGRIEEFVTRATVDQLRSDACGARHGAMGLLRKLAWFPEHFRRAALLLGRYVRAGLLDSPPNQDHAQFAQLFSPRLSGTRAEPAERLSIIDTLLSGPDPTTQDTGLIALKAMLGSVHSPGDGDFSLGGHAIDSHWEPRTFAECDAWYGGALGIAERLALSDSRLRGPVRQAVADAFRSLWCFGQVFDRLEATAQALGVGGDWPDGWIKIRETIAFEADRMDPGLLSRLQGLGASLAPKGFLGRLRAYVLTEAYRFADLAYWEDPKTDQVAEQAHQAVIDEAQRLGREVAADPTLAEGVWPDLFGPEGHQAISFGEGLGEAAPDLAGAWGDLLGRYALADRDWRNPGILVGFLRAASRRDPALTGRWLDEAVTDPLLAPDFPLLQGMSGVDQAGARRLIDSVALGLAPAGAFRSLWLGWTREVLTPAYLAQIVQGLAALPDGHGVAIEILAECISGPGVGPGPLGPELVSCGRALLRADADPRTREHYDDRLARARYAYYLAKIADVCFQGPGTEADAAVLSRWLADYLASPDGYARHFDYLAETLLRLHPDTVLDTWLGGAEAPHPMLVWRLAHARGDNAFAKVPAATLANWAAQAPEARVPRLAGVIPLSVPGDEGQVLSEAVLALFDLAPDRLVLLRTLERRLRPTAWGGSLAVVLERRRPLLRPFLADRDPEVQRFAKEIDERLQAEIAYESEREAARDRRDERFE